MDVNKIIQDACEILTDKKFIAEFNAAYDQHVKEIKDAVYISAKVADYMKKEKKNGI